MNCTLSSLKNSKVEEILPYVDLVESTPKLKETNFSCCKGQGLRLCNKDFTNVISCDLKKRIAKLNAVLNCFEKTWGQRIKLESLESKDFKLYWKWFILYKHRQVFKGFYIENKNSDSTITKAWTLALMGIWRLGIDCFVFNLKKHPISHFVSYINHYDTKELSPIVFLEIEEGIWNLQKKEEMSYLISWCEKHLSPLWILNKTEAQKPRLNTSNTVMKMFAKKIQTKKQEPFTKSLEKDTLSKLSTLCMNLKFV